MWQTPLGQFFCRRVDDFLADRVFSRGNMYDSVVFDLLKTADSFGMLDDVISMVRQGHVWSKDMWRKRVWERARDLDAGFPGGGGGALGYLGGCIRSLSKLKNTPKALISGQKSTLILIKR